jgi:hypothetical protein
MKPKQAGTQVLYGDGTWRPAKVLGWLRLDVAHKQPITQRWVFWLVQMQLADGQEAWFEYDSLNLRPQARSR